MQRSNCIWITESVILLAIATLFFLPNPFEQNFKNFIARDLPPVETSVNLSKSLKKDWHDYKAMYYDTRRVGNGEQGRTAKLSDDIDQELVRKVFKQYGFNALQSDAISVNRSIADTRHQGCLLKEYLVDLPAISVVIPFHNERLSVLLRSVHSIVNRTPPELLREIILVDDCSDDDGLGKQLDDYVAEHFDKVHIVRLTERHGLIRTRLVGLRKATAEVLVVFDSHIEVNHNWLPPLLEPIALDKRTVMCPVVDRIYHTTFDYVYEHNGRGAFDWGLLYVQLKHLPDFALDETKPYVTPIMIGCAMAISAEFFWELGGYDEGLDIWGGEQYELSFKIWMCGGQLLDAPCSRVGHLYRVGPYGTGGSIHKNFKRVAEVWMDEYKNYVYARNSAYESVDPGDITARIALRERLQCKPFKWYMEVVAFDILERYPPVEPPDYASGTIQSVAAPNLCVDFLNNTANAEIGLNTCAENHTNPHHSQYFALNFRRELRLHYPPLCLEIHSDDGQNTAWMWNCHHDGGNQFWYYNRTTKWLVHRENGSWCLETSPSEAKLTVNHCDEGNPNMKWNFGYINHTALDGFFENFNK